MRGKNVIEVRDKDFERVVLQSSIPVVVDFWAPWCGPCVAFGPVFENRAKTCAEEVEEQAPGTKLVLFVRINVDNSPVIADRFKIRSIPTVAVFKNGELVEMGVGGQRGLEIIDYLVQNLSPSAG